jgi:circadian clock protein KaiC
VTEPLDKIIRYGQTLEFFDPAAISDRRVIYEDLGALLTKDGLGDSTTRGSGQVLAAIERFLKQLKPGIVVIDSFRAFHAFAKDEHEFRLFLNGLIRRPPLQPPPRSERALHYGRRSSGGFAAADGAIARYQAAGRMRCGLRRC